MDNLMIANTGLTLTAVYKPNILSIPNAARIDLDTGEVTMLTPNPNDAANAFWTAVQQMFPGRVR